MTPDRSPEWNTLVARMEELARRVVRLEHEVRYLRSRSLRARLWRWMGIRLNDHVQHAPRPLRIPARYQRTTPRRPPLSISVVTPSYNQAAFLERTLRSVLDQDYPRLEYIVQDGGSRDDSPAILERYRARLHHLESAPDRGQADAINRGFLHAGGEILAWLNSDDLLLPGSLVYVSDWFGAHPDVDVIYSHRVFIDAEDREVGRWVLPPHCDAVLCWADYVPQETLFWRRRIWDRIGGRLDDSFQFALDWDLLLRFRAAGARIVRVPRFLGVFRLHDSQKTLVDVTTTGEREMTRLRERTHGRPIDPGEIGPNVKRYLLRQGLYHRLYTLGLLRA